MSGTKRTPIGRPSRHPLFPPGAVELFAELERTPRRQRSSLDFKDGERRLMTQLGLVSEYWAMCSVLDDSEAPCHPPGYIRNEHWATVRAVREELLEAAELQAAG